MSRYLYFQGPLPARSPVQSVILSRQGNPILDPMIDACYHLGLKAHSFGPWNPCMPHQLQQGESLYVEFYDGWGLSTVQEVNRGTAQVHLLSDGQEYSISSTHTFLFNIFPPLPPYLHPLPLPST